MSLELRRKVWPGETDLVPSEPGDNLITGKGEIFQGPCPSTEPWRSYTFKGWMGCQNKSIELAKRLSMETEGEF